MVAPITTLAKIPSDLCKESVLFNTIRRCHGLSRFVIFENVVCIKLRKVCLNEPVVGGFVIIRTDLAWWFTELDSTNDAGQMTNLDARIPPEQGEVFDDEQSTSIPEKIEEYRRIGDGATRH
ncbi:hypothetical protein VB773_19980 [Haloarculaceae archaeon H-GB2-1]|nr:hypothetical protein [Haloarculaceae archaeon H-GB1-1]MEA5409631.1 hypothetical protein [Haloarculaceae archaeon H-GB2-1]